MLTAEILQESLAVGCWTGTPPAETHVLERISDVSLHAHCFVAAARNNKLPVEEQGCGSEARSCKETQKTATSGILKRKQQGYDRSSCNLIPATIMMERGHQQERQGDRGGGSCESVISILGDCHIRLIIVRIRHIHGRRGEKHTRKKDSYTTAYAETCVHRI